MNKGASVLLAATMCASAAVAQTGSGTAPAAPATPAAPAPLDLKSKLINAPGTTWNIYGAGQTNQRLETAGPQGYPCVRVTVTQKGTNAWDVGAGSPVTKAIAAGDTLLIAVYLRAPNAKDGETVPLPFVGLNGPAPTYAALVNSPVVLTNQWKQFFIGGRATQAAAAAAAQVSIHLAGDVHVIDLGPIRVFDLGPDIDPARLPKNQ